MYCVRSAKESYIASQIREKNLIPGAALVFVLSQDEHDLVCLVTMADNDPAHVQENRDRSPHCYTYNATLPWQLKNRFHHLHPPHRLAETWLLSSPLVPVTFALLATIATHAMNTALMHCV
uniref:Uncharacterized protein n=1 Tax=Lygus hesperus TaxID=30085 RepID=A0A146KNF7_LYGHE